MPKVAKVVISSFLDKEFDYIFSPGLEVCAGMRVLVDFNGTRRLGIVTGLATHSKIKRLKPVIEVLDKTPSLSQEQLSFAQRLSGIYPYPKGEFIFMMLPSYIKRVRQYDHRDAAGESTSRWPKLAGPCSVNLPQENIFAKADTFSERYSLWKQAVRQSLETGSVLVCFPQLSYLLKAKQIIEKDFPGKVRVINSRQKEKEHFCNWQNSRANTLILGTRMSIFYYPQDLKLIVVEEENNSSYFQEEKPFYHLLDVAFLLSSFKSVRLVLSGDLPSLGTYDLIKRKRVSLKEIPGSQRKIKIVETGRFKQRGVIGPVLSELLRKIIQDNKKGVVLWNRKGFSKVISCSSCAHVFKCEHCTGFLQMSLNPREGVCPYCQRKVSLPQVCNYCKKGYLKSLGYGIERVGLVLKKIFPEARIDNWPQRSHNSQIILSTSKILSYLYEQKLFDTVFVLDADSFLARADYSTTFNAFIYFKQLSFLFKDAVYIFTGNINYYLFECLNSPWQKFYDLELASRKKLNLPPFGLVAKIILRAKDKNRLLKRSEDLYNRLEKRFPEVYGPFQENPFRLRDKFRYSLIVKTKRDFSHRKALKEEVRNFRTGSSLHLAAILQ